MDEFPFEDGDPAGSPPPPPPPPPSSKHRRRPPSSQHMRRKPASAQHSRGGSALEPRALIPLASMTGLADAVADLSRRVAALEEGQPLVGASEASSGPLPDVSGLEVDDPKVEGALRELMSRNTQLDKDLGRVKKEATRTIKRLKEKADTVQLQKDNLLKQLASRDAGLAPSEVTLEQITAAPVFQTMLDNIKKTSREEVTLLHNAIQALGKADPASYNAVLVVVDSTFKAANVENPLALLPRLPTS